MAAGDTFFLPCCGHRNFSFASGGKRGRRENMVGVEAFESFLRFRLQFHYFNVAGRKGKTFKSLFIKASAQAATFVCVRENEIIPTAAVLRWPMRFSCPKLCQPNLLNALTNFCFAAKVGGSYI